MGKDYRVLVTGSNGFVGNALCNELRANDFGVLGSIRDESKAICGQENLVVNTLNANTDWRFALEGRDTVVHLAGRAHVLNDTAENKLDSFRLTNTAASLNLAEQAADCGVSRFIFLSSIGVNGAVTSGVPFKSDDVPLPHTPYAISKLEAEIGLQLIAKRTNMEVVIIRSPAVYGKSAPGNFGLIEQFIKYNIPLPLGSINNKRSLVCIQNLVSFIALCIVNDKAANRLFLVSDNEDLSTPEIVELMGRLVKKAPKLIQFPLKPLWFIFNLIGKQKAAQSLMTDLQLDISCTRELLGWNPPFDPRSSIEQETE